MNRLIKKISILIAFTLLLSIGLTTKAQTADAAVVMHYCDFFSGNHYDKDNNIVVEEGNLKYGACHISYYHMDSPGKGKVEVDGDLKSQFARHLVEQEMADLAGKIYKQDNITFVGNGKYRADGYDIYLNQYITVIFVKKKVDGQTRNSVITMYPK
ncbi:hypothetical protein [Lysinibacillus capsici]|uniref:hypothetical protein n=1 Tax=Lysinibacillus capsici TaxID=2115968 RepID=UPI002A7F63AE|nr:hypothetical protein [Lysinibacillus capsici]